MTKTLYETLGIAADADSDEIKMAYKKKAQKLHPDREDGDEEAFKEIVAAYAVLVDGFRRSNYDRTGSVENDAGEDTQRLRELVAVLFSMIDRVANVRTTNVVLECGKVVRQGLRKVQSGISDMEDSIKDREEVAARISRTSGPNLLKEAVEADIVQRRLGIVAMQRNLEVGERILSILEEYTYAVDPLQEQEYFSTFSTRHRGSSSSF
jgi:curved DNA-binding protein CbpA